jgi:hypothetical protein
MSEGLFGGLIRARKEELGGKCGITRQQTRPVNSQNGDCITYLNHWVQPLYGERAQTRVQELGTQGVY